MAEIKDKTPKKVAPKATQQTAQKAAPKAKKSNAVHFKSGQGKIYVKSTFNTTYASFTNMNGDVVSWSSAGTCGFKGARRSTPFAATTIVEEGVRKAKGLGLSSVEVYLKGPGPGKDAALRVLKTSGLEITMLADTTAIPHNGCRPKKARRV